MFRSLLAILMLSTVNETTLISSWKSKKYMSSIDCLNEILNFRSCSLFPFEILWEHIGASLFMFSFNVTWEFSSITKSAMIRKMKFSIESRGIWGGGGHPTLVDVSQKYWKLADVFFYQKWVFFRNFRDVSTNNALKITFHCIFIKKFPKSFEKSAQSFWISKKSNNFARLCPLLVDGTLQ